LSPDRNNFYADWRAQNLRQWLLREGAEPPPERLLQLIWFHQRLQREELMTVDGRSVRVLHPGFWNREAGPDFRGAVVRFNGESPKSGDVEVDLHSTGWRAHRHAGNPNFQNVLLHVVWHSEKPTDLPTLPLRDHLDAPLDELMLWLGGEEASGFPSALEGQCRGPLQNLTPQKLCELLRQAALVRLRSKGARFQARARRVGWEQALWEGLLRALGYKHNAWPMQHLGELRPVLCPAGENPGILALQARLLGASGLLPGQLAGRPAGTDRYLRQLWDLWWRERESLSDVSLPPSIWRFAGIRPGNHPHRRLALAAHWLAAGDLPVRVERWCTATIPDSRLPDSLLELLQVRDDPYWLRHWNLRGTPTTRAQPLLGATRVADLAVNVILPWLWVRAAEGRRDDLRKEMERRFFAWPLAEDNAVLKLARQRLMRGAKVKGLRGAAGQQGLIQIVRDFCECSNAVCAACCFPDLVKDWAQV
jgi:hypothetical protein